MKLDTAEALLQGATARAEAAEAKLKWHEETQRTYYDVEARAAAAEAEVARLRAKLDKVRSRAEDEEQGDHIYFKDILDILDG